MSLPGLDQPFVIGSKQTPVGLVPLVDSSLRRVDLWGTFKARWGVGRMDYKVEPGLYGLGKPDEESPVLVTANYKMSFDELRRALPDRDVWILVLDTRGINVWCAAGKGTFGTNELVNRVVSSNLSKMVSHRRLIVPQLGAPGIAAHQVKERSGFRVTFGPIRAKDLPAFLDAEFKATPAMRRKSFDLWERAVVIPVELATAVKLSLKVVVVVALLGGLAGPESFWSNALYYGVYTATALFGAILAGAILTPLLLPWLPGRAFSLKGLWPGLVVGLSMVALRQTMAVPSGGLLENVAWIFIIVAVAAFLAMNFTGASTYTSLSGVRKEMRWAVPLEIAAAGVGVALLIGSIFLTRGV